VEAATTRGAGIGAALVRSGDSSTVRTAPARRAVTRRAVERRGGRSETVSVGTVALGRAQFGAQCCFSNYSNFARISKYKTKTILRFTIIETWHGVRVDHSKQLLPLGPLLILNRIQVIKLGTTSTLNFSLNF
jgi:hypothetical protein